VTPAELRRLINRRVINAIIFIITTTGRVVLRVYTWWFAESQSIRTLCGCRMSRFLSSAEADTTRR